MTVVILLGPPGAGKGTQASRIAERLGIPAISTGDIFRANMAEGTEIGKQAQAYMDRGEFVPDSVTNAMVKARLAAPDAADGFLLDGYPRSVEQAHVLRDMLLDLGKPIDVVLEIQVDEDEVADNMKKYGGFIPGYRAGRPTAEYLRYVINRITSAGALYLVIIALLPSLAIIPLKLSSSQMPFGGTTLLIIIGVGLQTVKEINTQLQQHHYEGFLK